MKVLLKFLQKKLNMEKIMSLCRLLLLSLSALWAADSVLVWQDEFEVDGLPDTNYWSYDVGGHGWGNGEAQYYTDSRTENARVEKGELIITALRENWQDSFFTSARLSSKNKADFKYGRFVIRAKLPLGAGSWPAIWMLPTQNAYGNWPHSGEIDIMENVGYDSTHIYNTIHTGAYNHKISTQKGSNFVLSNPWTEWHDYRVDWTPDSIVFYTDDIRRFKFANENATSEEWPFDQPFHLLLNVAVGGAWGGLNGIDSARYPQEMRIDYVRVYEFATENGPFAIRTSVVGEGNVTPSQLGVNALAEVKITATATVGYEFLGWQGDATGNENPLTVIASRDKNIEAVFVPMGEKVLNGDFSKGPANWNEVWALAPAAATGDFSGGELCVQATAVGTQNWHIQVTQPGIDLVYGDDYRLSFTARSESVREIWAMVRLNEDPYTLYSTEYKATLGPVAQSFSYDFTMDGSTTSNGRVEFQSGLELTKWCIDEVSLIHLDEVTSIRSSLESKADENFKLQFDPQRGIYVRLPDGGVVDLQGRLIP